MVGEWLRFGALWMNLRKSDELREFSATVEEHEAATENQLPQILSESLRP